MERVGVAPSLLTFRFLPIIFFSYAQAFFNLAEFYSQCTPPYLVIHFLPIFNRMKRIIFLSLILLSLSIISCQEEKVEDIVNTEQDEQEVEEEQQEEEEQHEEEEPPTKTELLTGGSVKFWNVSKQEPEEEDLNPTCKTTSPIAMDNSWRFYANGDFLFDSGEITEDATCDTTGCCGDMRNLTGTWEFLEGESKLFIYTLHDTDDPDYVIDDTLFVTNINSLTAEELILEDEGYKLTLVPVE